MEPKNVLTGQAIKFEDTGMHSVEGEPENKKYRVLILGDVTTLSFWHLHKFMIAFPRMDKGNEISMEYKNGELRMWYYTRDEQEGFNFKTI